MVLSAPAAGSKEAVALIVSLEDDVAKRFVAPLTARGLTPIQVRSFDEAPPVLHYRNVEVIVARAMPAEAFAALCASCPDLPVIAVAAGGDPGGGEPALRAGAVASVGDATDEAEVVLALDRSLAKQDAPPTSEEPPPAGTMQSRLLGDSEPMRRVGELVQRTAPSIATV